MSTITDDTGTGAGTPLRAGPREWLGLAVLALPTLLLSLDVTVLHLGVPHIGAALRPSAAELLWIVDVYGFMIAGFLVTMGTLGDRVGRRRLLLIGAAAFGVASAIAASAPTAELLIASRALMGVAGATLMPSTLSLIGNMFRDPRQRGLAIGVWATMLSAGIAVGPVLGGLLLERFWWGSVFLLGVPVMALLLVTGPLLLPEFRDPATGRPDLPSVALSLAAMLPVTYGVKELAAHGVAVPLVAGFVLVYLGVGPAFALGTDLVVGAAPPERTGAASAISETSTELGIALGIAALGSAGTAVYRSALGSVPEAPDTLAGAVAAAGELPSEVAAGLLTTAHAAFSSGMAVVAWIAAAVSAGLVAVAAVTLRRVASPGQ
ncbi:MFS transporter [Amycolatopsis arida]|uniref:MFS transporter n=1 Tax=Amycolatopsis arida TaxID=587909 RepID=UPI0010F027AA|nr:MFS transporter [Amycolatopsis arida]TDX93946.1 MFS transporter [Amycolatopsis arida]